MSNKKVYCKNCQKLNKDSVIFGILYKSDTSCIKGIRTIEQKAFGSSYTIREYADAMKKNKNNDCKDYKRKWWKIWV